MVVHGKKQEAFFLDSDSKGTSKNFVPEVSSLYGSNRRRKRQLSGNCVPFVKLQQTHKFTDEEF